MGNGNLVQPPDKEEEKKVSRQGKGDLFLHNDSVHDFQLEIYNYESKWWKMLGNVKILNIKNVECI